MIPSRVHLVEKEKNGKWSTEYHDHIHFMFKKRDTDETIPIMGIGTFNSKIFIVSQLKIYNRS